MQVIVSPPPTERILRSVTMAVVFLIFSAWFVYDGFVGWPRQNLEQAVQILLPVPDPLPSIDPRVTSETAVSIKTEVDAKRFTPQRYTRGDLVRLLGEPGWEGDVERTTHALYFGPGGTIKFTLAGELVDSVEFKPGVHDQSELRWQKILGFGLIPFALFAVVRLLRDIRTRVRVDDVGLEITGRPVIPFEAMTALDAQQYRKKGIVDLRYEINGTSGKVRLDEYAIRQFKPIVQRVCERRGFELPFEAPSATS